MKAMSALGLILFCGLWVVNWFFLMCWSASEVDESGLVYYLDHGRREYLPFPPMERAKVLLFVMVAVFVVQTLVMVVWVIKAVAAKFGKF